VAALEEMEIVPQLAVKVGIGRSEGLVLAGCSGVMEIVVGTEEGSAAAEMGGDQLARCCVERRADGFHIGDEAGVLVEAVHYRPVDAIHDKLLTVAAAFVRLILHPVVPAHRGGAEVWLLKMPSQK
jgi:hypothetical protein